MGSTVNAICRCGLNSVIRIGGGMSTFTYQCYFPCLCDNCKDIVEVNLYGMHLRCPDCSNEGLIPYDDNQVIGIKGDRNIVSWNVTDKLDRELKLTNGTYKCPKCGSMTLRFLGPISRWD